MRTTFHIDEVMCAAFIDDRDTPCTLLGPVSVLALVRFLQGVDVMAATRGCQLRMRPSGCDLAIDSPPPGTFQRPCRPVQLAAGVLVASRR